jgi:hypothetical protein
MWKLAPRAARHYLALERRENRRILGRRVGVSDRATDGASRADRQVSDPARRLLQDRQAPGDDGRELDRPLARHGAEANLAVVSIGGINQDFRYGPIAAPVTGSTDPPVPPFSSFILSGTLADAILAVPRVSAAPSS